MDKKQIIISNTEEKCYICGRTSKELEQFTNTMRERIENHINDLTKKVSEERAQNDEHLQKIIDGFQGHIPKSTIHNIEEDIETFRKLNPLIDELLELIKKKGVGTYRHAYHMTISEAIESLKFDSNHRDYDTQQDIESVEYLKNNKSLYMDGFAVYMQRFTLTNIDLWKYGFRKDYSEGNQWGTKDGWVNKDDFDPKKEFDIGYELSICSVCQALVDRTERVHVQITNDNIPKDSEKPSRRDSVIGGI